jgi:hypothetical protein
MARRLSAPIGAVRAMAGSFEVDCRGARQRRARCLDSARRQLSPYRAIRRIGTAGICSAPLGGALEWMEDLEQRVLLRGGSRPDLPGNALVLIAPRVTAVQLRIAQRRAERR